MAPRFGPLGRASDPDLWELPSEAGQAGGDSPWCAFNEVHPRGCRQNNLAHITIALIWQIARKEASFLAYLVATARHCLKVRNAFSTK